MPAHAGNARCPAWNSSAAASALSKLGKYIDFLVFIHRVKSGANHREPLSCFNGRQLPCSVFKTFSPYLQGALGAPQLCGFVPFVCYTPSSQSALGWALSRQDSHGTFKD